MSELHLVRLELDRREMMRLARTHRRAALDEGYLLHAALAAAFAASEDAAADVPLHNFVVDDTGAARPSKPSGAFVLGYSDLDEGALRHRLSEDGSRIVAQCMTRPVPRIAAGTRVSYRTRVCPVVRSRKPGPGDEPTSGRRKSRELDAWLAHRIELGWTDEPPPSDAPFDRAGAEWLERQEVYGDWLGRQLSRDGASDAVGTARMESFQRATVHRKGTKGRRTFNRPDVVLEGELDVRDAEAFRALLRRGVGRHRAFGFGCLLIRPA
ncbi:MAG TPA: hypothetical protein DEF51_50150 [Myxococcales bacterium]|nr:hypothetical protein [Myxococcales bacterium]